MSTRMRRITRKIYRTLVHSLQLLFLALLIGPNTVLPTDELASIRRFTRPYEFEFVEWNARALALKWGHASLSTMRYTLSDQRSDLVLEYFEIVRQVWRHEYDIQMLYSDPAVSDPQQASQDLRLELSRLTAQRDALRPLAEAVLQAQVSQVAADFGLTLGGQPLPPVLYHTTDPPNSIIISPRHVIRQDHSVNLIPEMTLDEIVQLEDEVAAALDVSTLTVGIGGIALYPAMMMETTNINWLAESVAHEWMHHYLMLRPLGATYGITPENRIINETSASIAGVEMGQAVIARYYPAFVPEPEPIITPPPEDQPTEPPEFDFRAEMHQTRVEADRLLAAGEIEAAEAYMEARRLVFWEQGYRIRKLNQAFFAFHGAYADQPGGAAGEDPVSAAVRSLRQQSSSLAGFINRIAWIWSYEQLTRISD